MNIFLYFLSHKFRILQALWGGILLCCLSYNSIAQNQAARYEIDAKRQEVSPTEQDALPRGREFVRLDSTYYVGWMYMGLFMFDRSADEAGYQKALPNLQKAFLLLEKDYTPALQSLYNSTTAYIQNNRIYSDYLVLAQNLRDCYEYLDRPDSAIWVIHQLERKNFKRDANGMMFGTKAWIIHRNRFYTQEKYSFLKPTVAENAQMALQTCYEGFGFIQQNRYVIDGWFGNYQSEMDHHFIYHYLAMIHSYMQQYDSSEYYYNKMAEYGTISWNNYGSLKHEMGQMESATQLYSLDQYGYGADKRLMEPFYYLPILSIYAGKSEEAIETAQQAIAQSQSFPGFGWYNIALARGYIYNGQLDSADVTLTKAANFKEVHIGTTLTQPQYDFTIKLLRLVWFRKQMAAIKFEDRGWWYKPKKLYRLAALYTKKYLHQYALATQLAENPERERIIYDLFCGESTVSFDEIYTVMELFSPRFFSNLMDDKTDVDPRVNVKRYFQLTKARLLAERGKDKNAKNILLELYANREYDVVYEKLFRARVLEQLANVSSGNEKQQYLNELLAVFPQLLPFGGNQIKMGLYVQNADDALLKGVVKSLKNCNIDFVEKNNEGLPMASILFNKKGTKYEVVIDVKSSTNQTIVQTERFMFQQEAGVPQEIAMRLFGKGGAIELDQ